MWLKWPKMAKPMRKVARSLPKLATLSGMVKLLFGTVIKKVSVEACAIHFSESKDTHGHLLAQRIYSLKTGRRFISHQKH